jgi:hypothetical protein
MKAKVLGVIAAATIIVVAGIVIVSNAMSTASSAEEDQATVDNMTNTNVSNDALGRLIMVVEFKTTSINPVNQTFIEVSTASNVTIIPPNSTGGKTIRATETANASLNILPNGLGVTKGKSVLVTEGTDADEIENATSTFVGIIRITPDGPVGGTDVVTFHTDSTGQLAFLDNLTGIMQSEFSPGGGRIRTWEWNGGALPFPTDGRT